MFLGCTALDRAVDLGYTETAEVLINNGEPYLNFVSLAFITKSNNCDLHFSWSCSPISY